MRKAMRSRGNEEVVEKLFFFCFGADDLKNSSTDVHFHKKKHREIIILPNKVDDKVDFEDSFSYRLPVPLLHSSIISYFYYASLRF